MKKSLRLVLNLTMIALIVLSLASCEEECLLPDPAEFTVTFNMDGGVPAVKAKIIKEGKALAKPNPDPKKEGHDFAGWYGDAGFKKTFDFAAGTITENTTLYAKWDIITYTVTFDYNDGGSNVEFQKKVNHGEKVNEPNPIRTGYIFLNWYSNTALTAVFNPAAGIITQDTTLYAKWDTLAYTVTFNYNDGGTATDLQQQVNYDQQVSDPKPTRAGYTFANWYSDRALVTVFDPTTHTITQDTTLYAGWDTLAYTVTFNYNDGGTATDLQQQVNYDQQVSDPKPTRTGYTFANWYSNVALTTVFDVTSHTITQDTTLYAKWDTLAYTVVFNYNDGGTATDLQQQVEHGQKASDPQPTRTGYTFANWCSNAALTTVFDPTIHTITQDTTLYAKWDTLAYTVTFNYNDGGTATDLQQQVNHDQKVSAPKPTRTGYTFVSWHSDRTLATAFDPTTHVITRDTILYAKWTISTYTVVFNYNDGGTATDRQQQVNHDQKVSAPKPTRTGYTFANWYSNATLTAVFNPAAGIITQDTTLYAKWDTLAYTVTFNYNDGGTTTDLQQQVNYDQKVSAPKPTRTGYTFANWYSNVALTAVFDVTSHTITQDTTLYVKWDTLAYTVTFNYNDGGTTTDLQQPVNYGEKVSDPKPTRTGYTFANWYSNAALTAVFDPTTHTITQDTTLYAKWDTLAYTVTFNYNDGGTTTDLQQQVNYGQKVSAPKPTRTGYTFANWYSNVALTAVFDVTSHTITQDTTLYAKWDTLAYTVTFNYNDGGTATDLQQQVNYDQKVSAPKPTRTGYTFASWYSNTALTAVFNPAAGIITQDTTLYAKWDTLAYTVTFNYNDGGTTTDLQQQVNYDQKVSAPKPTRTGYTFANWYSNVALTTVFDVTSHTITQDTTLYVKWDTLAYTVTFNYNDGGTTTDLQQPVNYGKKVSAPKPTRTGYTFANWYSNTALTAVFNPAAGIITQDTTLYAKWDTLAYTVTFNYNNGGTTTDLQQQVNYDQKVSAPKPTRTGYTFANWYSNVALTTVFDVTSHTITQDTTLYAGWDTLAYTVTFNYNDGGTATDLQQQVNHDQKVSAPKPTRTGYTFAKWYSNTALTAVFNPAAGIITQDTTLYAKWDTLAYTVTFNYNNGGTTTDLQQQVNYDQQVSDPKPTRTGYTFANWYSNVALTTVFDVTSGTITQDTTLYVKWDTLAYTVTFNYNDGGTATDLQQQVNHDQKVSAPKPTRTGYTFANWYSNTALTAVFNPAAGIITQDTTLYAKWDTLAYTVTFNYNNGGTTTDLQQQVNYDQQVSDPKPTRTGYTFANWYSNVALTTVFDVTSGTITQDTTLYVKWDTLAYTVTFNYNDGGTATDLQQPVNYNQQVSNPKPTRTGYTFANWYSNATLTAVFDVTSGTITQDTTLYAKWDTLAYTVTFNYNDGGTATDLQQQVNYDQQVSDPKPTRTGYTFANWYSNATLTAVFDVTSHTITQDTTLYAGWDTLAYTVTFNYNNGGTATDLQQPVNYNQQVSDPKPTRTGYTFAKWYSNATLTAVFDVTSGTITQDTTLYAGWDTLAYTVTFNYNDGGTATDLQKQVNYGKKVSNSDTTRTGYSFLNWYSNAALTAVFDPTTGTITQDTTLYAKWKSHLVYIPDLNFRNKLKSSISTAFVGDSLNLISDKVAGLRTLSLSSSSIQSLEGIQYFTGLQILNCERNNLTTLDVSKNTQLIQFNCRNNQLDSLDVSTNAKLTQLYCDNNELTKLNVSGLTDLTRLDCINNRLDSLDVSTNTGLLSLTCSNNRFTGLDVSNNIKLTFLNCNNNRLAGLDVSTNTKLRSLICHTNRLAGLDVSNNTALTKLACYSNRLTGLDVSNNTALTTLECYRNQLTQLDVSSNIKLTKLTCNNNRLDSLDVSTNTALQELWCYSNQLDSLDVSNNTALTTLISAGNPLISVDIRGMRSAGSLTIKGSGEINNNEVRTLKVHENLKNHSNLRMIKTMRGDTLTISTYSAAAGSTDYTLVCGNYNPNTGVCLSVEVPDANFRARLKAMFPNAFVEDQLDTTNSAIKGLKTLNMSHSGADSTKINDLTGIQYFPNLEKLVLNNNNLTDLDVSKNTKLTWLELDDNQLDSLDVSNNTALTVLDFAGNSLTGIDLSRNTELIALTCYDNQLDSLDISNNTKIIALDCRDNGLSYLDMRGVRLPNIYSIQDTSDETNAIKTLKVHEKLKNESEVAAVKTAGGTIKTYRAAAGSTSYSLVCGNYNPTTGSCSSTP